MEELNYLNLREIFWLQSKPLKKAKMEFLDILDQLSQV